MGPGAVPGPVDLLSFEEGQEVIHGGLKFGSGSRSGDFKSSVSFALWSITWYLHGNNANVKMQTSCCGQSFCRALCKRPLSGGTPPEQLHGVSLQERRELPSAGGDTIVEGSEAMKEIFTVGHSNRAVEEFLELLATQEIQVVVDVRSSPYSKFAGQFNREPLRAALKKAGLYYIFMGDAIGGVPSERSLYDEEGYVDYGRVAATDAFGEAMGRLLKGVESYRTVLMCGEEDPQGCHRHLLDARVLREKGVRVLHIRGDGSLEDDEDLCRRDNLGTKDNPGQNVLFGGEEVEAKWRSLKPVGPDRFGGKRRDPA